MKMLQPQPMSKYFSFYDLLEYYRFMKIKMKLSYIALSKGQTFSELIIVKKLL